MFTDIEKHGATILDGMDLMKDGFVIASKAMVEGGATLLLTTSLGLGVVFDGVGHILYDGMMALPKVGVCR